MELTSKFVSLFYPARCLGCHVEIKPPKPILHSAQPTNANTPASASRSRLVVDPRGSEFLSTFDGHWCDECWRQLSVRCPQRCRKCGANLIHKNPFPDACSLCHGIDLRFERAISTGNYRGLLQELIIRMKNQHDEQLAVQLGYLLAYELMSENFLGDVNLVVPVPTFWWRRIRRGFQASEVASETIASTCDVPYAGQVMRCLRSTKKQGTLSTASRFQNVRGAFEVHPNVNVSGLNILLVDDVMTSGATASELARVLKGRGAAKVYVGVIARGARVS